MPVRGLKRVWRLRPESMTASMPSMVRLLSAMRVASTILRVPGGGAAIAASCARGSRPA
jgi:hypothetical protein